MSVLVEAGHSTKIVALTFPFPSCFWVTAVAMVTITGLQNLKYTRTVVSELTVMINKLMQTCLEVFLSYPILCCIFTRPLCCFRLVFQFWCF